MKTIPGFTQQNLFDIFVNAMEGGSTYWAKVKKYHWMKPGSIAAQLPVEKASDLENFNAVIIDIENAKEPEYAVNAEVIQKGLERLYNGEVTAGGQKWEPGRQLQVIANLLNGDDDMYDADIVVQAGLFGDLVYG